jgi:hypothetical protein
MVRVGAGGSPKFTLQKTNQLSKKKRRPLFRDDVFLVM